MFVSPSPQPGRDFGWYDNADWGESFTVEIGYVSAIARAGLSEGFITYRANTDISESTPDLGKNPSYGADVYLVEVSPPGRARLLQLRRLGVGQAHGGTHGQAGDGRGQPPDDPHPR